tara:strand:- start:5754 stop:8258 length:2505 start_codon:yes stop_codon:yes gene_type:complete
MDILEFVENNGINVMPLPLNFPSGGKKAKEIDFKKAVNIFGNLKNCSYHTLEKTDYVKHLLDSYPDVEHIALRTRGVAQLDFDLYDGIEYSKEVIDFYEYIKKNTPYYKSVSKKRGIHAFIIIPTECYYSSIWKSKWKQPQNSKEAVVELLSGIWGWASKNNSIENADKPIIKLDFDEVAKLFTKPFKTSTKSANKALPNSQPTEIVEINESEMTDYQKMLLNCGLLIDQGDLDAYHSWIRWVSALANDSPKNWIIAKKLSSLSRHYDLPELERLWTNVSPKNSIGSFYHYCRLGNEERFRTIRMRYHLSLQKDFSTDHELACYFLENQGEDIIYKDDDIYHYQKNRGLWLLDNKKTFGILHRKVRDEVSKYCRDFLTETTDLLSGNLGADERERLEELEKEIRSLRIRSKNVAKDDSICKMVKQLLSETLTDIEFDLKGNLFSFRNITFNLDTCEPTVPLREDYCSQTTGYDYEEPTEEMVAELGELEDTIFPIEELKTYYRSVMFSCLVGQNPEVFILANGNGGNGKGVWHELMTKAVGDYFYKAKCSILLQKGNSLADPDSPSAGIANMDGKRVILMTEPEQGKRINNSLLKELTGGNEISARALYSNKTKVRLAGTFIMECNERPKLQNCNGIGEQRRLIDFPFVSTFHIDEAEYNADLEAGVEYVFKGNPYFKTPQFQDKYKNAFIRLLLNHKKNLKDASILELIKNPPKMVKDRTLAHINSSNDILQELNALVERLPREGNKDENYVKIKDIYNDFKRSSYWDNLSKADRRELNFTKFTHFLETDRNFRNYYCKKLSIGGGKTSANNVLIYCKKIEEDCPSEEDAFGL